MRRAAVIMAVLVVASATACLAPNPGPSGLYLGVQPNLDPVVTPKAAPITWGSAPAIDPNYGRTLYPGTAFETPDPRPPLVSGNREPLRLWVASPNTGLGNQPAIVWVHGGGFALGLDSAPIVATTSAREYARRGYVGFSVEYRIDTMLIGTGTRPPTLCSWVQDNVDPSDPVWVERRDRCERDILTAQYDVQGAIRWIRRHAAEFGVDPNKIAVGGFSAGAVVAAHVAYRGNDVGTERYFTGDDRSVASSKVRAAFGASGCLLNHDLPLTDIGPGDVPVSFIASRFDPSVSYSCVAQMVTTARAKGLVAELTSYCDSALHAEALRDAHLDETDATWTTFLAREMPLYSGMPPATAAPICP